jgi:hypothetical protein
MGGQMAAEMTVDEVFNLGNLIPNAPVPWRTKVSEHCAGIYVVALTKEANCRVSCTVDVSELEERERQHWLPNELIIYIGQTTKQTLAHRVDQFYNHKYGKKSPHRGGQAVHLLQCDRWVYWAPRPDPKSVEKGMIEAFRKKVGSRPFANRIG